LEQRQGGIEGMKTLCLMNALKGKRSDSRSILHLPLVTFPGMGKWPFHKTFWANYSSHVNDHFCFIPQTSRFESFLNWLHEKGKYVQSLQRATKEIRSCWLNVEKHDYCHL